MTLLLTSAIVISILVLVAYTIVFYCILRTVHDREKRFHDEDEQF